MKRFLALFFTSVILLSSQAFAADTTRYVLNNKEISASAKVIARDGYLYLPVAEVFRGAGYRVIENSSNNSVTVENGSKAGYFSVFAGKTTGRLNGKDITLGKAPFIENGEMYVSSKFIEEQMGVKVSNYQAKNTVYLDSKGEGKITSTSNAKVNSAPSSKPAVSSTGTSSVSYKMYPSSNNLVPDFGSVTGVTAADSTANTKTTGFVYNGVTKAQYDKYVSYLKNLGYEEYNESETRFYYKDPMYVSLSYQESTVSDGGYSLYTSSSSYLTGDTSARSTSEKINVGGSQLIVVYGNINNLR